MGSFQAFPQLAALGQAGPQRGVSEPLSLEKAPMLMSYSPLPAGPVRNLLATQPAPLAPQPAPLLAQKALPLTPLTLPPQEPPVVAFSDEDSESTPPPPCCMSRVARRRLRQRENKKRGKAEAAMQWTASGESLCTEDEQFFQEVEVVVDLPAEPRRAPQRTHQAAAMPAIPIEEVCLGSMHTRSFPKVPFESQKSVPVCAYQAVERLSESPMMFVQEAAVIESHRTPELPLRVSAGVPPEESKEAEADIQELPVVNTFIHYRVNLGSSRRSRSCSL